MDDLLWNGSWSKEEDSSCEESVFVSDDPSQLSSPPLQELQTVARMLGLPEVDTPAPEMRRVEKLVKDSKFLCERENSWPEGASTVEVLVEELENDKGFNLYKFFSPFPFFFFWLGHLALIKKKIFLTLQL